MHCCVTDVQKTRIQSICSFRRDDTAEFNLIVCYPDMTFQKLEGFGAALTESSAYVFAQMPPRVQDEFLRMVFGGTASGPFSSMDGNAYALARTHVQSCDFSLGTYAHVKPYDKKLRSFSIERDKQFLVPFLRCCLEANPELQIMSTPWSPPAFMKTISDMKHGGCLKHSYYETWAQMLVRYVQAYRAEGVPIAAMSVQNEPMAQQEWESCLFSAREELEFARDYLQPALEAAGVGNIRLFCWDHNKDRVLDRAMEALGDAPSVFDGVAFHGYAGDHFEGLQAVSNLFPEAKLLFTEGCVDYSPDWKTNVRRSVYKAERYAHEIMGNLNAGACGFIDWNVLLDECGGPNHVGNFCEATLMYDRPSQTLHVNRTFTYIGHFSSFIRPGAQRFLVSRYTDKVECTGFVNPTGERVLIVLNRADAPVRLCVAERPFVVDYTAPKHSISTFTWSLEELALS